MALSVDSISVCNYLSYMQTDITPLVQALELSNDTELDVRKACLCGTLISRSTAQIAHSGVVNYEVALCESCSNEMLGMCKIVCLGCNTLGMYVKPTTDRKVGFKFEKGKHYHISKCSRCVPGLTHTPVLEKRRFMLENHIPDRANEDILSEIHNKDKQAEKESVGFVNNLTTE